MDNLGILIQAILSLKDTTDSKNQIAKELPKLESQLQSDKNTRVKIVAGLDITKSKSLIQSQLNTLTNQAKAPTIKIGIDTSGLNSVQGATQNITNSLQTVQTQAQQAASVVSNSVKQEVATVANAIDSVKNRWLELYKAEHNGNVNQFGLAIFEKSLQEIVPYLEKDKNLLNDLYNNIQKFNSTEGLRQLTLAIANSSSQYSTFKSVQDEVNKQFQETIYFETNSAKSTENLYEKFRILTNQLLKYEGISKSISQLTKQDISKTVTGSIGLSDNGVSTKTIADFYNFLISNTNKAEAEILQLNQGLQQFNYLLNGLKGFNDSGNGLGIISRSTNLDLNTFSVYLEPMQKFLAGEKQAIAEAQEMDIAYKKLKQTLIETFGESAIFQNGNYTVTLEQLKAVVDKAPLAQKYIDNIESRFASLPSVSNQSTQVVNSNMAKVEEQTKETTVAIEQQIKATEELKAVRDNITRDANNKQISRTSVYGDKGFTRTEYRDENDKLTAYTDTTNYEKISKELAKANVEATKLQARLDSIQSKYEDVNASKSIKDDSHLQQLGNQYNVVQQAIENVRTADSNTMAQMKANADAEIKKLEDLTRQFRNAEYAANALRERDITTVKNTETNDLNKFIAQINSAKIPVQSIKNDIEGLKTALANVTDKESLTAYLNQFDVVKSKFDSIKVTYNSITSAIKDLNALQNSTTFNKNASNPQVTQTKQEIAQLLAEYQKLMTQMQGNITPEGLIDIGNQLTQLNARFNDTTATAQRFEQSLKDDNGAEKLAQRVALLKAQLEALAKANPKALKRFGNEINSLMATLNNSPDGKAVEQVAKDIQILRKEINNADLAGKTFFQKLKDNASKFTGWMSMTYAISLFTRSVREAIVELKDIDTILTEISKTSDRTAESLKKLGETSFATASKYGQKASDYLLGVQEMSRAGFGEKESEQMAELSTLAQSAGDMTAELANEYLIATNAGYQFGGSAEKLNSVLDSQNYITNHNALNMSELAEATKIVSSQASQAGIGIDEMTAAVGTMIATTQQGGEVAARAFKGILMNLQQVKGTADDIGDGGEDITTESLTKYEKACADLGVSLKEVKDGVLQLRDPMVILEELANAVSKEAEGSIKVANLISAVGGEHTCHYVQKCA